MQQVAKGPTAETRAAARRRVMTSFFDEELERHIKNEKVLARRISRASKRDSANQARKAKSRYMSSLSARVYAVHKVDQKRPGQRTSEDILEIACSLDVFSPSSTLPRVVRVPKSSTGYRETYDFSFEDACRHQVIVHVLRYSHSMPDWTYGVPGRGANQLVSGIIEEISEGAKFVGYMDIRNCFDSFTLDRLAELLKLPQTVVDATIRKPPLAVGRRSRRRLRTPLTHRRRRTHVIGHPTTVGGLQGLPQGSAVSNVVATLALSDIGIDLPHGVRLFVYCDDIFVTGRTRKEVSAGLEHLQRALENHPCGPLSAGSSEIWRRDRKIPVLGHIIQNRCGKLSVRPSGKNKRRFWIRISELTYDAILGDNQAVLSRDDFVNGWMGNFSKCVGIEAFHELLGFYLSYMESLMTEDIANGKCPDEVIRRGAKAPGYALKYSRLVS